MYTGFVWVFVVYVCVCNCFLCVCSVCVFRVYCVFLHEIRLH